MSPPRASEASSHPAAVGWTTLARRENLLPGALLLLLTAASWRYTIGQGRAMDAMGMAGQRGGVYEAVGQLVTQWLPTQEVPIDINTIADETRITMGDIGMAIAKPLRGANGEFTRLLHGAAAFRDNISLANGRGTYWRDPEMRQWESLGHAEITEFDWSV